MRRHIGATQCIDTAAGVVGFVRAQRHAVRATERLDHVDGGVAFGGASGLRDLRIVHQAMAVLHQQMPQIGQLRF
jgi:hypothetical protein